MIWILWVVSIFGILQKGLTLDLNPFNIVSNTVNTLNPINIVNNTVNALNPLNIISNTADTLKTVTAVTLEETLHLPNLTLALDTLKLIDLNLNKHDIFKNVKSFSELANETGLEVSEYEVTTSDDYILTLFHIESNGKTPVLLVHGILDSSDTFILRRDTSLTKVLVDAGYDVWLMNCRGNKYSRKHLTKNPDVDKDYWDFSFNEMGTEDLPAVIDFVLSKSDEESLFVIGHSQGTQISMVMGAEKTEYNNKVKALIALAPVCFLQNVYQSTVQILIELAPLLALVLEILGVKEIIANEGPIRAIETLICSIEGIGYVLCVDGIINPAVGGDNDQLDQDFFKEIAIRQYPTGTSMKNLLHLVQINKSGRFCKYDEGTPKNMVEYLSVHPPEYEIDKVIMKVFTFEGENDKLATKKDTDMLAAILPNLVKRTIIDRPEMNHLDFVWGKDAYDYLYSDILKVMQDNL